MSDSANGSARRSIAARRVGIGNRCACGENRPLALIPGTNPIICAECKRKAEGRTVCDLHHVAGKSNHHLTIPIPVNDHRAILSEAQYDWPKTTLENRDRSPFLAIAGCIRGLIDVIRYLLDELLAWVPQYLEELDAFLVARLGSRWWSDTDSGNE